MTTADLRKVLAGQAPYVNDLAVALTDASRLGHAVRIEEHPQGGDNGHEGALFTCSRCWGVAAWMPGQRLAHRGLAADYDCADLIRRWIDAGVATPDQRAWLAEQEQVS